MSLMVTPGYSKLETPRSIVVGHRKLRWNVYLITGQDLHNKCLHFRSTVPKYLGNKLPPYPAFENITKYCFSWVFFLCFYFLSHQKKEKTMPCLAMLLRSQLFLGVSKKKENACRLSCWSVWPWPRGLRGLGWHGPTLYCFFTEIFTPIPSDCVCFNSLTDISKQETKGEMYNANDCQRFGPI